MNCLRNAGAIIAHIRLAVISDIHGNHVALEAVLADMARGSFDQLVCLGDAIQGGPQPAQVAARLREIGCPVVMGNADDFLLTGHVAPAEVTSPERGRKLNEIRAWSLAQLSEADRAFIGGFRPTVELDLGGGQALLCFHGSPASYDDVILPATSHDDLLKLLGPWLPRHQCGGHTHIQHLRRLRDSLYFNPGAVGLAYNHDQDENDFRANPWAEYAALTMDGPRLSLDFRRVPYDPAPLIAVYQSSGRPYAAEAIGQYQPR
jgi:predicted phosphodiesterase